MGCCTGHGTAGGTAGRRTAAHAWMLLLVSGTVGAGCVFGNDSDGPILAVDVQYDRSPSDRFLSGTCDTAGVLWVEYELRDDRGKVIKRNGETEQERECELGYEFSGLGPGEYSLHITGYGEGDVKRWDGECELSLGRFDTLALCRIDQLPATETDAPAE